MYLLSHSSVGLRRAFPYGRQLLRPLAISLIIHGLLWWQAPGLLLSPESSATRGSDLRASLQPTPRHAPPIEQAPPTPPEPAEPKRLRQPEERTYPRTSPAPLPQNESPPQSANEPATPDAQPNSPVEPLRTGIDVTGLREYHLALGQKARQFRRYPQAALDAGWQGRVAMRLSVSEAGVPIGVSLLGSSNYPVIDQAALEMMYLAAGHTEVPERLRGRAFTIDLAVDFNPDDPM